jgi:hypothetical protein
MPRERWESDLAPRPAISNQVAQIGVVRPVQRAALQQFKQPRLEILVDDIRGGAAERKLPRIEEYLPAAGRNIAPHMQHAGHQRWMVNAQVGVEHIPLVRRQRGDGIVDGAAAARAKQGIVFQDQRMSGSFQRFA